MGTPDDFAFDRDALRHGLWLLEAYRGETPPVPPVDASALPDALPENGAGALSTLEMFAPVALGGARRLDAPGFFAHMDPPTPPVAWVGALWAASLNQNLLHPDTAPVARDLEAAVVRWLAPFFGMSGGHLVPGSTLANLTALWAARETVGVEEVVASAAAHLSVRKAANLLGLRFRALPSDATGRLLAADPGDLRRAVLVLTAGTTATGAIDPLDFGAGAAWRHVDAAWAGPLRFSPRYAPLLHGVGRADSVAVSAHKWLFQPKESAVVFFADAERAHAALSFGGGYLAVPNVGVLGSHGAAALPLAMTLLAWGARGVAAHVERCMALAATLAERVAACDEFELFSPPVAGVVLWRPHDSDPRIVRDHMRDAFVSLAEVDGKAWFRSVAANPMADPELVVADALAALKKG